MDYYCGNKFEQMQVHVQARLLYNCHKAYPERLNIKWLEANPGMLFHSDQMLADRRLMLQNKPCAACDYGCYKYEQQGLVSERLLDKKPGEKITDPYAPLKHIQIILSTDCNLACVYCSSEFSTRWQREISSGGHYALGKKSINNDKWTNLWGKIKQQDRSTESKFFSLLLREIGLAKELEQITLLGGEPLLNNRVNEVIKSANDKKIIVITGLGVGIDRLRIFLEKNKNSKIKFSISAESTKSFFEFIRHGSNWNEFKEKVDLIKNYGFETMFISTMSNLCLFDFHNFYNQFAHKGQIAINPLSGNTHMSPHVMDDLSKEKCMHYLDSIDGVDKVDYLKQMLLPKPTDDERKTIGSYLRQLSERRGYDLRFLPEHFLRWCEAID